MARTRTLKSRERGEGRRGERRRRKGGEGKRKHERWKKGMRKRNAGIYDN